MSITYHEKEATVSYLEYNLLELCKSIEQHVDPDAVGTLYELAYEVLTDMEQTLQTRVDQVAIERFVNKHRS